MEVVAVDLRPLRPLGANGGIKPAIFSLIREAGRQKRDDLLFVFLTNSASHAEVRALARPHDILVCVLEEPGQPLGDLGGGELLEYRLAPPPENFLAALGVDLLYCPFGDTSFHAGGIPSVALIADLLYLDYPFALGAHDIAERNNYVQLTIRNASKIQCISLSGMQRFVHHYGLSLQSLFYTHLPVHERLSATVENPAGGTTRQTGRPYFFYPANMWKHKNHESLFLGYYHYLRQVGDAAWDLVLTFHEDERAGQLRKLAAVLGIADHVVFKGHVPESQLHQLWQNAGALVFPSLHEGFGIPLIEAMHYGVPIISGDGFSLKELAGDAALPVDPRNPVSIANGLHRAATDERLRASLVARGKSRLKFFDLEAETKKMLSVFTALIKDRGLLKPVPARLNLEGALLLPTPAASTVCTIQIKVDRRHLQNRYSIYLDGIPYGAFCTATLEDGLFSFECAPGGRVLAILAGTDPAFGDPSPVPVSPLTAVEEVAALNADSDRFVLHTRAMEATA